MWLLWNPESPAVVALLFSRRAEAETVQFAGAGGRYSGSSSGF